MSLPSHATISVDHAQKLQQQHVSPLNIVEEDATSSSNHDRHNLEAPLPKPTLRVANVEDDLLAPVSRSASSSSSLDPYYFGIQSPAASPVPPLPLSAELVNPSGTPENLYIYDPITPARDPTTIDRRALVGVGELATPRWVRKGKPSLLESSSSISNPLVNGGAMLQDIGSNDDPDSPWTIEAVDGEWSEKEVDKDDHIPRPYRIRPSVAEESGGEEILYPRKSHSSQLPPLPNQYHAVASTDIRPNEDVMMPPPTSFVSPPRRPKKRTSDEFEMDQTGALVSKPVAISTPPNSMPRERKEDRNSTRKHRSLNMGNHSSQAKARERRRESVHYSPNALKSSDRHARHTSASSTTILASRDGHAQSQSRRVPSTDNSQLPQSPASSTVPQFLKAPPQTPPLVPVTTHASPSVAHAVLRGTQEGWSVDDEATMEALRKLDGLSGKSARARASVGSLGRPSSSSRPGTPGKPHHWEGIESVKSPRRVISHSKDLTGSDRDKDSVPKPLLLATALPGEQELDSVNHVATAISSDEQNTTLLVDKSLRKAGTGTPGNRTSFTPKRGSASSATYPSTPTVSSRDSASTSTGTALTSLSSGSSRAAISKTRRNSAGSDISSINSTDAYSSKDRVVTSTIIAEAPADPVVPPVPPLPKDLTPYKPPLSASTSIAFPTTINERASHDSEQSRTIPPEVPAAPITNRRQSQHFVSGYTSATSAPESTTILKTPSKKWSFSSALNLKLTNTPSNTSKSAFPLSPRSVAFGPQLRKSTSKDQSSSKGPWSPDQPSAMTSATSLNSISSVGSVRTPATGTMHPPKTPDHGPGPSPTSSTSNHTTSANLAPQTPGPLSPSSSIRRGQSKRLTPSSIPFFKRSSSQSMQVPSSTVTISSSPTSSVALGPQKAVTSPKHNTIPSAPPSSQKKSSVLSLGLPSLLKGSSSRRSLHADSKEPSKDVQRTKETKEEKTKQEKRKEDKDRSESRISHLISRKRGKTLSSTEPRKPKSPVSMPPIQVPALAAVTAERVARLKPSTSVTSIPPASPAVRTPSVSSRLTAQTISSMQKQSDSSLRSRTHLPTIAGSPSVVTPGGNNTIPLRHDKDLVHSLPGFAKETPTKIPRISSRTSAVVSPPPGKPLASGLQARRTSTNPPAPSSANPSPTSIPINEFGVIESGDSGSTGKTPVRQASIRASPSIVSRVPRQSSGTTLSSGVLPRKSNRDSISFGIRKASTGSVNSVSTPAAVATESTNAHPRFPALSPSKGLKFLSPKVSLSNARPSASTAPPVYRTTDTPSSSRQSISTPSPAPSSIDEEELLGDEEMMHYIRKQQAKKLASGATQEELDEMLKWPEAAPPVVPVPPQEVLRLQPHYLSEYERKEILDYPNIYCIGAHSKKKMAVLDDSTNNYSYDDERGDYQVVNHDHLAYRYEVVGSLGKGSFGQVLHCRDHCTGESVAVKIIRNKKRFHHQALVEIKILDSLRKWDAEERHHVIKMTEHFYFRNHLCIATELLSINLYELIKANGFAGFTTSLIRRFTGQMLMSLSLMRHHRIVHCDLKPENVLLRHPTKSAIKVIDFGSSCFEHEKIYTYIQSRFYRSPEVILGMNYHMAIDMWSLGCILAELYTGYPIFPGENEQEQLSCIMEILGVPDKEFVNRSSRKKLFFDVNGAPRIVTNSKGRRRIPGSKSLTKVLGNCKDEDFVDFIAKCLVWDPERRMKPQAAMRHPFVTAGRRQRPIATPSSNAKSSSTSSLSGSRTKQLLETPKKSLISAPTPLTARASRTVTNGVPATPGSSHAPNVSSTSRSFRSSQTQGLSAYHTSRTLSGYASTATK
ncbi:hypothetical protein AX16_004223 [Volvariella volvacea WC 439]|nr:hypothetical protein AX16_004223 [Volvariella volvacea WC 439]